MRYVPFTAESTWTSWMSGCTLPTRLVATPASSTVSVPSEMDAAIAWRATIYTSGIEPGFAGDQFAVLLSTLSNTIRSVRAREIFDYSAYPNEYLMVEAMGFGRPLEFTPLLELEGRRPE